MIQMRIRRILLFSIMWSSSLLLMLFSTSSLIVKVDAKLHLWVKNKKNHNTTEEDNLSLLQGRGGKSIRDRLKLFHNHDDDDENTRATTHYSASQYYDQIISSPTEYLSFMLQYISSNIQAMSDYLYSSDVSSNSRSRLKDILSEPKDAFEGLLAFAAAIKSGYLGGVKSVVDGVYELGYGTISACISLIGAKSNDNKHPLPYAFFTELANPVEQIMHLMVCIFLQRGLWSVLEIWLWVYHAHLGLYKPPRLECCTILGVRNRLLVTNKDHIRNKIMM